MWYIPSPEYYAAHPEDPCERFKNDGDMEFEAKVFDSILQQSIVR